MNKDKTLTSLGPSLMLGTLNPGNLEPQNLGSLELWNLGTFELCNHRILETCHCEILELTVWLIEGYKLVNMVGAK